MSLHAYFYFTFYLFLHDNHSLITYCRMSVHCIQAHIHNGNLDRYWYKSPDVHMGSHGMGRDLKRWEEEDFFNTYTSLLEMFLFCCIVMCCCVLPALMTLALISCPDYTPLTPLKVDFWKFCSKTGQFWPMDYFRWKIKNKPYDHFKRLRSKLEKFLPAPMLFNPSYLKFLCTLICQKLFYSQVDDCDIMNMISWLRDFLIFSIM